MPRLTKGLLLAGLIVCLGTMPSRAAVVVTTIASSNSSGVIVLTPSQNIPAGSLIIVVDFDNNNGTAGAVTDSSSNSYATAANASSGTLTSTIFYAYNVTGVTTGGSITYTPNGGGSSNSRVVAAYATGIQTASDPFDANANATGTSNAPSVTSSAPVASGELFVGFIHQNGGPTFTQAGGWSSDITALPSQIAGDLVNSGSSAQTYAPATTSSSLWLAVIASFKAVATASPFIIMPPVIP